MTVMWTGDGWVNGANIDILQFDWFELHLISKESCWFDEEIQSGSKEKGRMNYRPWSMDRQTPRKRSLYYKVFFL